MSDFNRGYARPIAGRADMSVDAGLRAFMLGVYNKVALGLVLSAALAWLTSHNPVRPYLFSGIETGTHFQVTGYTPLGMILMFAPLVVLIGAGFFMRAATPRNSGALYWTIVSLIGASFGAIFLRYTGESVASTFLITATAFGGLSLVGYTTKRDLTAMGSFLMVGLIGIIVAGLVNLFLGSAMVSFIISVLGVLIFAGLIAYDTQRLKMTYYDLGGNQAGLGVATNYGALSLYLDFINLFQFLLSIFGNRR
jgi:FtsH-binding integral membrane protein